MRKKNAWPRPTMTAHLDRLPEARAVADVLRREAQGDVDLERGGLQGEGPRGRGGVSAGDCGRDRKERRCLRERKALFLAVEWPGSKEASAAGKSERRREVGLFEDGRQCEHEAKALR